MNPRYDISFTNYYRGEMLPVRRRKSVFLSLLTALLSPIQWLHSLIFDRFANGLPSINKYNKFTNYTSGTFVIGANQAVYMVVKDHIDKPVTDNEYWVKIQDSFIGLVERMAFKSDKSVFEYALNTNFSRPFNNPPAQPPIYTGIVNDIYIVNNKTTKDVFYAGINSLESSKAVLISQQADHYISVSGQGSDASVYDFTIFYKPAAKPSNLLDIDFQREIYSFAIKINLAGMRFNVLPE